MNLSFLDCNFWMWRVKCRCHLRIRAGRTLRLRREAAVAVLPLRQFLVPIQWLPAGEFLPDTEAMHVFPGGLDGTDAIFFGRLSAVFACLDPSSTSLLSFWL